MPMDSLLLMTSLKAPDSSVAYRIAALVCAICLLTLSACGPSTDSGIDGPVMRHPERSDNQDEMAAEVRGLLELEGSCLYVSLSEVGERYPIVWPSGTQWSASGQAVVTPGGLSMAIGSEVYGGGGYLDLADVERIAGSQAATLAAQCIDNTYGEVAVLNNTDTAIGPAQP